MQINISRARRPYTFRLLSQRFSTRLTCAVAAFIVFAMTLSINPRPVLAKNSNPQATAQKLTQSLIDLNGQLQRANPKDRSQLLDSILAVAAERWVLLTELVEDNPAAVLQVALPAHLRDNLPPMAQTYIEKHVQLEGRLDILHEDSDEDSQYRHFLKVNGERLSLHFATHPTRHLLTDARVRVTGVQINEDLVTEGKASSLEFLALNGDGSSVPTATASAIPNTFGEQRTLVILVNFQDNPTEPYTLEYARNVIFGAVNDFILENSYEQTWLTGDVVGWYTIPLSSTVCDTFSLEDYANSAATDAGVDLSAYSRLIYAFPENACYFWGSASVGGNPSRAYIRGDLVLEVAAHEFGHNLGLQHSHSWAQCPDNTIVGNCYQLEYGDGLDIMGWSNSGHFNAPQKERLGWLNDGASPPITTVTSSGTYTLAPYETIGTEPKALKILKYTDPTTGIQDWYYVEFRQAIGFDSYLDRDCTDPAFCAYQMLSSNILNGVEIRWVPGAYAASGIRLLDMTPNSIDPYTGIVDLYTNDPALTEGNSFSDPDAGLTITTSSADPGGASVTVKLETPVCTRANPAVTASPVSQAATAGSTVNYTISVHNNDGAGCSPVIFDLDTWTFGAVGWSMTLGTSSCSGDTHCTAALSLNPGDSASVSMTMTSASDATGSSYSIPVTAINRDNASYSASTSPTYIIGTTTTTTTLSVSVSTDSPSYTGGDTVAVTAKAISGEAPLPNASVIFTVMKPNGDKISQTATTDMTGKAVGKFRLNKKEPDGVYEAHADVTKTSMSGSNATSFMVTKTGGSGKGNGKGKGN